MKVAHRATKNGSDTNRNIASANKAPRGERTEQQAADKGRAEYREVWKASDTDDTAEEVLKAIEAMMALDRSDVEEVEILLFEWTGEKV